MKRYNVAVVGVGAVGVEMLRILKERKFPIGKLCVLARSSREITVDKDTYLVKKISPGEFDDINIALFAGTEGEKGAAVTYAHEAIKRAAVVIDNGADFRLKKDVPLIIPEVNAGDVKKHKGLIANPNCATIQMVVALNPIYKLSKIRRVIVASYQAASGAGTKAVDELFDQTKSMLNGDEVSPQYMTKQIAFNVFPHIGGFGKLDYTSEEWKTVYETHKIMHDENIKISTTTVRVPVKTGHSQAIYLETQKALDIKRVRTALKAAPGVKVIDNPSKNLYPVPIDAEGKDEVFVGRIRRDPFVKNGLWLWVVSDNLRKGAALNAIQIAEELI